ncbi:MAG: glycerol-3-phosphate acyltransferase [Agathobacter sp.]|nr:glycerol-3-phosphate acyltransferase [Agathobacter sp.]
MINFLLCATIGYFIGCINPAYLIGKKHKIDIREKGSGNAGATNVMLLFGKFTGLFCALFDILKAYFAIRIVRALFPFFLQALPITGTAVILGHIFPFYMNFRGGKGFACLAGNILAFDIQAFLFVFIIAIIVLAVGNYLCLMPITASILFPIVYLIISKDILGTIIISIVPICISLKHKENLLRIKNGTELHFSYLWKPEEEMKRIQTNGEVDDETVKERFLLH